MQYNTSIYLDKRKSSKKVSNLLPVKLRIYSNVTKKTKLYQTGIDLSIQDFDSIFDPRIKVRGKKKEVKIKLQEFENRADEIAKELEPFTFESFEKKMFRGKDASISIEYHYKNKIRTLTENDQISTASNYDLSLKSFDKYIKAKTRTSLSKLTFYEITPEWLNGYERFMVNEKDKSKTTVSIYLRTLRTIFNDAISENDIKREIYPFGSNKGKYQVPQTTKKKQALSREQLSVLFNAETKTQEQEMAKDFWFFSYACNGINIKDILLLKYENICNNAITYYRAKTINTKKANLKEIKVFLNDYAKSIITKYGNSDRSNKQFIFPILNKEDKVEQQQKKIKNFTSFVNLHINKIAKNEGFEFKISSYWARHSFATLSIRKGASMEFISDALNHSNLNVTKNYFAGFEDETQKEFANQLMDF